MQLTHGGSTANVVNHDHFIISLDTTDIPLKSASTSQSAIIPQSVVARPTVDGIERLMNMDLVKQYEI